jgi:hypothetical protein
MLSCLQTDHPWGPILHQFSLVEKERERKKEEEKKRKPAHSKVLVTVSFAFHEPSVGSDGLVSAKANKINFVLDGQL